MRRDDFEAVLQTLFDTSGARPVALICARGVRSDRMTDFDTPFQAVTAHATRAVEEPRQHGLVAGTMNVVPHQQAP